MQKIALTYNFTKFTVMTVFNRWVVHTIHVPCHTEEVGMIYFGDKQMQGNIIFIEHNRNIESVQKKHPYT